MAIVDLHTHSAASDGQYAPAALVGLAKEKGFDKKLDLYEHRPGNAWGCASCGA